MIAAKILLFFYISICGTFPPHPGGNRNWQIHRAVPGATRWLEVRCDPHTRILVNLP